MTEERSILVAMDLPTASDLLGPVIELALATGWKVHLLHAAAPEPSFVGYDEPGGVYDKSRRRLELTGEYEQLAEQTAALGRLGVEAEGHVLVGSTIEVVLDSAEAWNAALIAVVEHKHGLAHRLTLGSVTSSLLKAAHRPVLVLPGTAGTGGPG